MQFMDLYLKWMSLSFLFFFLSCKENNAKTINGDKTDIKNSIGY